MIKQYRNIVSALNCKEESLVKFFIVIKEIKEEESFNFFKAIKRIRLEKNLNSKLNHFLKALYINQELRMKKKLIEESIIILNSE